jgi:predicted GIY-YIG superfamily endonuclease
MMENNKLTKYELKGMLNYNNIDENNAVKVSFKSLVTISELLESSFAKDVSNIMNKENIISYHNQRAMPFYNLNGQICYRVSDVQKWARVNLLSFNEGKNLIPNFFVCSVKERKASNIPPELSKHSKNLWEFPTQSSPCVYFLIDGVDIVYVGQSKNLSTRIISHKKDKNFTRVIYMVVAENDLDKVERFYEEELLPKYNKAHYVKKLKEEKGLFNGLLYNMKKIKSRKNNN